MDVKPKKEPRCGACREVWGAQWQGFVYCHYLNQDVWAESIMCNHGRYMEDIF